MKFTLTGRHFNITPHLKAHVEKRITRLDKYNDHILEAGMVLFRDHATHIAEGRVHVGHAVLTARAEAGDMYGAVNEAVDRMLIQIKRHEGKLRDRKRGNNQ
ncbi:MAG: ribosome-associated translation inhibitor RaiA [candidate division WOR-3 bacterium]|nr:MAG: ribosome-associated translation inhibitor RaiA [candidate division WOR-3 bacterium]